MFQNLITSGEIDPSVFPLSELREEAAIVLNIAAERISEIQCWQYQLWVNIQGVGGKFISYRRLRMWKKAALEAIKSCTSLEHLQELGVILRIETQCYGKYYSSEDINQLRQAWANQSQEIKAETERLQPIQARQEALINWQQSWIQIIRYCRDIQALKRLQREIQQQSEEFLEEKGAIEPIEKFWFQRWHELVVR